MKKRVLSAAMTSLLALAMLLAGCSGSQTTQAPAEQPKTETPATSAPEPAKTGPKQLIVGRGGDTVGLDPIAQTDGESFKVTENIFDTLVGYAEESTEVVPSLAEKWEISPDGLTYTFHLRSGVKFHDGTDFNAEAVKWNFERWSDKNHPQHNKEGFEYYNDMFGGYKGDETHVIKSVEAVDAQTVKFTLNRPLAPFIQNLGMSCFAIASPKAVQEMGPEKFNEKPVGTGPFKFVEWKRNDTITLEKNPDYWNAGFPKLDKLVFKVIPENTARLTALTSGEIDMMDGLNPDDAETVKGNSDLQLILRPSMNIGFVGFNVEKKPLDNPKVREAIAYAVNKPAIIDAFFAGLGQPAVNPMPPSIWGHNSNIQDREFNIDKAKQLLTEAGFPNGFKIKFWAMPVARPYMPDGVKIAEAIQQDLKKIGVEAEIVTMEWATYLEKTKAGEQEMFMLGWTGDNGDPDNFLATLLDKNNIGGNNRTRWANEEAHKLLMAAQSATTKEEREKLYLQVQEIIFKDVPMVPLAHSTPALAAKANIINYKPHPKGSESLEKVDLK
ncbi:ABC transporter substrate-binding protein [Brevibacillus agri]|uniref:ABC transporter substrate-binding protein n=1 Tax=Brevibacillus agri TaxID=51101 RepID=A0A3M8B179_9BACL|nr:ABC transporter substrate-binding protein [Brevibacillus agri]ELK40726.1 ABC transporter substrate-binding protein [Brevibacillus agri BAB-2500]MBG9565412.1 peptide ABC transporter substrate-binding protein [Brevibacillus agri]QAV14679.1 ABC transporter substrate-binding protein [Brevibacillus agri]RNB57204.1 ABC transporter substrate-binding protein [Brevibacillus agri]WHX32577.1 ABC transporter substrate-binding protein [Brevibacillus agri]